LLHNPLQFFIVVARTVLLQDNTFFYGFFGQLSFDFIQVPALSIVSTISALLLSLGISEKLRLSAAQLWALIGIVVAGFLGILGAFYLTFSNVAEAVVEGVQGRYFLPFLLIVMAILAALLPIRLDTKKNTYIEKRLYQGIALLSIISLTTAAIKFYYVLLG